MYLCLFFPPQQHRRVIGRFVGVIFIYILLTRAFLAVNYDEEVDSGHGPWQTENTQHLVDDQLMTELNLRFNFFFFPLLCTTHTKRVIFSSPSTASHHRDPQNTPEKRTNFTQFRTQPHYSFSVETACRFWAKIICRIPTDLETFSARWWKIADSLILLGSRSSAYTHPEFQNKIATTTVLSDLSQLECFILSIYPSISDKGRPNNRFHSNRAHKCNFTPFSCKPLPATLRLSVLILIITFPYTQCTTRMPPPDNHTPLTEGLRCVDLLLTLHAPIHIYYG